MICTTLNRIRPHSPREVGWRKLLAGLGKTAPDDEPLPYARIVEINGLQDALWACRAEPQYAKEWRLFAVWCARETLRYTDDWRAVAAVQIAECDAHGMASDAERAASWDAALAASWDAERAASWDAALAAALAATTCAAAEDATDAAARDAAWAAAREAQMERFLQVVGQKETGSE